jgi:hypothetical protein
MGTVIEEVDVDDSVVPTMVATGATTAGAARSPTSSASA